MSTNSQLITLLIFLSSTHVSSPVTDNLNVSGRLPSELGTLSSLQYLNIGEFGLDVGRIDFITYCVTISQR